ncbi:MAG: thiamine phosphate synthase [Polyangiaceae bacterium]|nr:thiamine phosphate synthase [Polyangiaceae bacterium]
MPARGLYAIVDVGSLAPRGIDPLAFADAVLAGGPVAMQLRAKGLGAAETLGLLCALAPRCRERGVPLFANDRVDLAVLAGATGVHLGQTDLPVALARRVAPACLIGVSTHTEAQLEAALDARPDYVAVGPVFATATKRDAEPTVGLTLVRRAVAASSVPVVAIGGLDEGRAAEVARAGALVAVIGALLPTSTALTEVTERARHLQRVASP